MYLACHGKCLIVTCMDPKEVKSLGIPGVHSWACLPALVEVSQTHMPKQGKSQGGSGLHLGTRVSSSGGAASSGSDVFRSLGVVTPTVASTLGISNSALSLEEGAQGPEPHPTFQGQSGCHSEFWRWATCEVPDLLCRSPPQASWNRQCIFGEPWPMSLSLQPAPLNNPKLPWSLLVESSPFTLATLGRMGQSLSNLIVIVQLATWRQWLAGRPFFGLEYYQRFCLGSRWVIGILSTILVLYHSPGGKRKPNCLNDLGQHQFPSKTSMLLGKGKYLDWGIGEG